jgi:CHASE3 domain sensor protein
MANVTPKICDLPSCENSRKVVTECQTPMAYALSIQINEKKGKVCQALRALYKGVQVLKTSSSNPSKRANSANGYFIGVATKFLNSFDKSNNEIVTKLFESMDLPSTDELKKYLNHSSLRAMLESGLDFEVNELVNEDVACDYNTAREAQLKFPQWDDVFEKLIKEKFPSSA